MPWAKSYEPDHTPCDSVMANGPTLVCSPRPVQSVASAQLMATKLPLAYRATSVDVAGDDAPTTLPNGTIWAKRPVSRTAQHKARSRGARMDSPLKPFDDGFEKAYVG